MSQSPCIVVDRLEHVYGDRVALNGVSFEVAFDSIFGFAGPNGGGKSTVFHILSTLLPVQRGSVQALGFCLGGEVADYCRNIGVTFQSPSLDRRLTVWENLIHQGHLYGLRGRQLRERSDSLLDLFGVRDRAADPVETLSGGLKRRVELAKCLLHRPRLLLLDEPSTGLDPGARQELWRCLEELRSEAEVTVVLTTHLMVEAEGCDELILLDRGSIAAQGSPSNLRASVKCDSVTIVSDAPEELRSLIQSELGFDFHRSGDLLVLRSSDGPGVLRAVVDRFGDEVRSISLDRPSLEDVFLEKTGRCFSQEESPGRM